jgi:hypothetical protein
MSPATDNPVQPPITQYNADHKRKEEVTSMTTHRGPEQENISIAQHPDIQALGDPGSFRPAQGVLAAAAHGLALLAGAYAAISPWVVGFHDQATLPITDLIVGLAVAVLAWGYFAPSAGGRGLAWVYALMGVWLVIAPWVVQDVDRTTRVLVSNIIVGAVIAALGAAASLLELARVRRAR